MSKRRDDAHHGRTGKAPQPRPDALSLRDSKAMAKWQSRNPRIGGLAAEALPLLIACDSRAMTKRPEYQTTVTLAAWRFNNPLIGRNVATAFHIKDRIAKVYPVSRGLPSVCNGDNEQILRVATATRLRLKNIERGAY